MQFPLRHNRRNGRCTSNVNRAACLQRSRTTYLYAYRAVRLYERRTNRPDVANFGIVTMIAKQGTDTMAEKTTSKGITSWQCFATCQSYSLQSATGWAKKMYQATTATVAPSIVPLIRYIVSTSRKPERGRQTYPIRKNDCHGQQCISLRQVE